MFKEGVLVSAYPGPWVEAWLSQPRFARYIRDCGGDRMLALRTYEWNIQLAYALMRDAAHFEVALRNAYDRAFTAYWNGSSHWLLDAASPVQRSLWRHVRGRRLDVNVPNRKAIAIAVRKAGSLLPDAVVSQLTLGFWEHLSDAVHEQTIWIPCIYYAWPKGTSRAQIDQGIHLISTARNRAAHNEPIYTGFGSYAVLNIQATINQMLVMLDPDLAAYVQQTSTVTDIWLSRPKS